MITKEFVKQQEEIILKRISTLEKDLKNTRAYEDLGSASEDEVQEFEEFEEKTARGGEIEGELLELRLAQKKIQDGTYGLCEKCGGPIEPTRLKAFPQSRLCASDK